MCPEEQTKLVGELEGTSCEEQLRTLGRCGLEKGRLRGEPTALCSFLSRAGHWELLSSPPWYPGTGHEGMVQSCTSRAFNGPLGGISIQRGCSSTGTDFLEKRSCPSLSVFKGIWTAPLTMCLNLASPDVVRQVTGQ